MTPKLLLTSVCKPFGLDDGMGMRSNPCELWQNQVTREQGIFSIRAHNRSFGLEWLAANVNVPTTVLDFPTEDDLVRELQNGNYTHVGVTFIVSNLPKAQRVCALVRQHAPTAKIIAGGHGTRIPDVQSLLGCDEVCIGEGIRWLRRYFGEDETRPIAHPALPVEYYRRVLGVPMPNRKAVLIPGVGCANMCEFCCTSHFFRGYTPYVQSADELFTTMCRLSAELGTDEFFVLDENFLGDEARVHRLVELMEQNQRLFVLDIFSTLRDLARYDPKTLVKLGIEFVWIGIESRRQLFAKTEGIDAAEQMKVLKQHGISVLASTILFLDHHDEKTVWDDVDYTIGLGPDYLQFMAFAPFPGTALYERMKKAGRLHDLPWRYWHGQDVIWFDHPHFTPEESKRVLDDAFRRDYYTLGPSILRNASTRIHAVAHGAPWRESGDAFLQARYEQRVTYARQVRPLLPGMRDLAPTPHLRRTAQNVIAAYDRLLGPMSLLERAAALAVRFLLRREQARRRVGRVVSQPPTVIARYRQQ